MAEPKFGQWPTWTDPWGRTIKGYEDGEKGYPRLDFRPLTEKTCSGVTSGIGTTIFSYEQLNVSPSSMPLPITIRWGQIPINSGEVDREN